MIWLKEFIWNYGPLGPYIVALVALVVFFGGLFAVRINERHRRNAEAVNKAASSFREAFLKEIELLSFSLDETDLLRVNAFVIMSAAKEKQEKAISVFKMILNKRECKRLDQAWEAYCYPEGDPQGSPPFCDYISDLQKDREMEARSLACQKIKNILKLAQPK